MNGSAILPDCRFYLFYCHISRCHNVTLGSVYKFIYFTFNKALLTSLFFAFKEPGIFYFYKLHIYCLLLCTIFCLRQKPFKSVLQIDSPSPPDRPCLTTNPGQTATFGSTPRWSVKPSFFCSSDSVFRWLDRNFWSDLGWLVCIFSGPLVGPRLWWSQD